MNRQEIRDATLRAIGTIAPNANIEDLDPGVNFRNELSLDSMDFLEVLTKVRDETGVEVPERDYEHVQTVEDLVDYVAQKQ